MTSAARHNPRSARAREVILAAAADLLESDGFRAMTMDAVVARAGASKATLYRHWRTKAALAMDALLAEVDLESPFPDTGSAENDVRSSVRATVELFARPRIRQMLLGVLVEVPHDAELRAAFRDRYVEPSRLQGEAVLRRGVERGEFRGDLDRDVLFDEIYGAIYLRLLIDDAPVDQAFADKLVRAALDGARQRD